MQEVGNDIVEQLAAGIRRYIQIVDVLSSLISPDRRGRYPNFSK